MASNISVFERAFSVSPAALAGATESLFGRDLCSLQELSPDEARAILDLTTLVKAHPGNYRRALDGRQMVLVFEKPSLRTRITFEVAINTLGGSAIFVDQTHSPLGARESLSDVAQNLERWVDVIVLRTSQHHTVTAIANHATVPVINALTDVEHPCQALCDFFTLQEKLGDLHHVRLAFVGDGNNVAHSLILASALLGSHISIATPPGFEPASDVLAAAELLASTTGATIQITHDPQAAVRGANAVYADVWASMGQEHEADARRAIFQPYQVNKALMAHAAPDALFMHCLPAHRDEEATTDVVDGAHSVIFDQAENRMHVQKAILLMLLGGLRSPSLNGPRHRSSTSPSRKRDVVSAY